MAQWIRRRSPKPKTAGSSPVEDKSAWMSITGVVCRLQICRSLTAQWFDSTFCASDSVAQNFDRACVCDGCRFRKLAFFTMVVTNQLNASFMLYNLNLLLAIRSHECSCEKQINVKFAIRTGWRFESAPSHKFHFWIHIWILPSRAAHDDLIKLKN